MRICAGRRGRRELTEDQGAERRRGGTKKRGLRNRDALAGTHDPNPRDRRELSGENPAHRLAQPGGRIGHGGIAPLSPLKLHGPDAPLARDQDRRTSKGGAWQSSSHLHLTWMGGPTKRTPPFEHGKERGTWRRKEREKGRTREGGPEMEPSQRCGLQY